MKKTGMPTTKPSKPVAGTIPNENILISSLTLQEAKVLRFKEEFFWGSDFVLEIRTKILRNI